MKKIQTIIAAVAFSSTAYSTLGTLEIDFNGTKASPSGFSATVAGNVDFNSSATNANDLTLGAFATYTGGSTGDTSITKGFVNYNGASAPTIGGQLILSGGGLVDISSSGSTTIPALVVTAPSILDSVNGGTAINLAATSASSLALDGGPFVFGSIAAGSTTTFTGTAQIGFNSSTNNQSTSQIQMPGDLYIYSVPTNGGNVELGAPYAVYAECDVSAACFSTLTCLKLVLGNHSFSQNITVGSSS